MEADDEIRRLARLVELNRDQLLQLDEQQQKVSSVLNEHRDVIQSLKDLEGGVEGHFMTPLGAGVALKHTSTEEMPVIVDIGSNIHIETPPEIAAELLIARTEQLGDLIQRIEAEKTASNTAIQQYAKRFEILAQQQSDNTTPLPQQEISGPEDDSSSQTRTTRRSPGGGLTLDD